MPAPTGHSGDVLSYFHAAADLLLGASCPGCRNPGWGVCSACRTALSDPPELIDRQLGVPITAACQYRPLLEHIIPRYKDDGALHLNETLATLLARAVWSLEPPPDAVLVPVPSRPSAVRLRGFDHGRNLAGSAARRCRLTWQPLLARRSTGEDQLGLGRDQRQRNLDHSMFAKVSDAPLIVVDDVATSGASLREAVRALRSAGTQVIGAAVIAQAEKLPQHLPKPTTLA